MKKQELSPGEKRARKIGGRLYTEFVRLKEVVENLNTRLTPFFLALGVSDIDILIKALETEFVSLRGDFSRYIIGQLREGKENKRKYLKEDKIEQEEGLTAKEERSLRVALSNIYKNALSQYDLYKIRVQCPPNVLKICRRALYFTPSGIKIDGDKFIELYLDFVEADKSIAHKLHQQAADALNKFFNGAFPITEGELKGYFIIEGGLVKINPDSVTVEKYSRLGKRRGFRVVVE